MQIRGERTCLRPVSEDDLELLVGWLSDPEVYRWWDGYPKDREEVAEKYIGQRRPGVESFIVELDDAGTDATGGADSRPIGYVQYWHGEEQAGGLDMFLVATAREQGLGPDAARALVRYLFEVLGWTRVTVDSYANNPRAIRAWGKAGFVFERELPEHPGGPAVLMAIETGER